MIFAATCTRRLGISIESQIARCLGRESILSVFVNCVKKYLADENGWGAKYLLSTDYLQPRLLATYSESYEWWGSIANSGRRGADRVNVAHHFLESVQVAPLSR
jgi:hypothetical protein